MSAGLRSRLRRTFDLLHVLTASDIRVRYGRGKLQAVKWVADPFAALGVYLLLIIILFGSGSEAVGLSLACAIVPFQLLLATVVNATGTVSLRSSIILNMRFPGLLIPASAMATESIAFLATLTILPVLMVVYGVGLTFAVLWMPIALAITAALALALAYPSTLLGIWYPDLAPFVVSVARAAFFLAPGLIALEQVTGIARDLLPINPLTGLFEMYRDALLYGVSPAAWEILVPLAAAALILLVTVPIYRREQQHLAKLVG
jgi:ABC-2 type transport system permease protein